MHHPQAVPSYQWQLAGSSAEYKTPFKLFGRTWAMLKWHSVELRRVNPLGLTQSAHKRLPSSVQLAVAILGCRFRSWTKARIEQPFQGF
ncbi:hypothetical protein O181_022101 [Austropuccinia psidii MF-1]|uniref:Uncharacterized protein n=1 Tax=Austropuccinia psidii MF-1 TaxID=1389203 RepID=A0A9Q3CC77_9BASI|nr:hypothetical protein [Austropuccinia psidii MF-1]